MPNPDTVTAASPGASFGNSAGGAAGSNVLYWTSGAACLTTTFARALSATRVTSRNGMRKRIVRILGGQGHCGSFTVSAPLSMVYIRQGDDDMPKLEVEGVGSFEVPQGKRLVNALTDEAKIDQLHACGGNARCTTC